MGIDSRDRLTRLPSYGLRWRVRRLRPILRKPLVWRRHWRGLSEQDVILDEYPKSGSTWLAFMLGQILFDTEIDFENSVAYVPGVGRHRHAFKLRTGDGRLLRSHEPYREDYRNVIYLVRHVGDVAVSYFKSLRWVGIENVSFDEFLPMFLRGHIDGYGSWSAHVNSWLDAPDPRLLLVKYEDVRIDPAGVLSQICSFLGFDAAPEKINRSVESNTIEGMREKEARARATVFRHRDHNSHFVRKGAIGDSLNYLSEESIELIRRHAGQTLERLGYGVVQKSPEQPSAT
jgi:hypothetical protein